MQKLEVQRRTAPEFGVSRGITLSKPKSGPASKAVQTNLVAIAAALLTGSGAFAAGFEKTVLWSGRYSGIAGVTSSNVEGAEALAFNPAGILVSKADRHEMSANLSVVQSQFKGPIASNYVQASGQSTFVAPFELTYAQDVNESLAFAVGTYTAGGAKAEYDPSTFAGVATPVLVKTDLSIQEVAVGVAYKPLDKLKIGAAWRMAVVNADFASYSLSGGGAVLAAAEFSNLKDTEYTGYRLGAQWTDDAWGLGLAYRSEMIFNASGNAAGTVTVGGTALPMTTSGVTVTTALPQQLTFGGHFDFVPKIWRGYAEYDFTNYSRIDAVTISGKFTAPVVGQQSFSSLRMNWIDQHTLRLAGEYMGYRLPIRFGYALTSQVTSTDYARAAFTPPGPAHTFTLGTGLDFLASALRTNAGLDYTFASGSGSPNANDLSARAGDYAVSSISLHMGISYLF